MRIPFFILLFGQLFTGCKNEAGTNNTIPVIIEGEHFSYVLYNGLSQSILDPIKSKLEDNYSRLISDLEIYSMDKVTVRIWENETQFLDDMEQAIGRRYSGAGGWVYSASDIRILYRSSNTSQIAFHEFCHAASLMVNSRIGNNPRWLWESVAIYESGEFIDPKTISYLVNGNFPTLAELNSDFSSISSNKIYDVGYLVSEYIIFNWGRSKYLNLIKSNGNIQQTLEISAQQFEAGWKNFVISKYF